MSNDGSSIEKIDQSHGDFKAVQDKLKTIFLRKEIAELKRISVSGPFTVAANKFETRSIFLRLQFDKVCKRNVSAMMHHHFQDIFLNF
jgi:hypothetical protein